MDRSRWALAAWVAGLAACGAGRSDDEGTAGDGGILTTAEAGDETATGDGGGDRLDLGSGSDIPGGGGDCMGMGGDEEFEFSYIWIANSPQGTVSKIDTKTGIELARYFTGPSDPDPSRTSVNQLGDVAVANRSGSVVKIAASIDDCVDGNQDGEIQTSSGADDILPWGSDECVLWYRDLGIDPGEGNRNGPRPIAWEPTKADANCNIPQPRLWVGWYVAGSDEGVFHRLDGVTGQTQDEVVIGGWDYGKTPRPYGGAVNAEGDFFATGYYGPAIRIDAETLAVEHVPPIAEEGAYGMAMDLDENVWIGGCDGKIYFFDTANNTHQAIADIEGRARGVMVDENGIAWFAGNNPCRVIKVDTATKQVLDANIPLPGCGDPVGISIDIDGYVWVVDRDAERAYKLDPDTHEVVFEVEGLIDPYTYSDMTGQGLGLVAPPPQG